MDATLSDAAKGRSAIEVGAVPAPDLAGLEPLETAKPKWPALIGALFTIAMVVGLGRELFGSGLAELSRAVPDSWLFYLSFAAFYMSLPIGDYIIFRKLWGIPIAGLIALIKKRIANDVVFGYSGEAYFYAWARAHAKMVAAPFGAVKDVSILSAIAGNGVTLLMIVFALPLATELLTVDQWRMVAGSGAIIVCTSLPFLIFSRRVFSLRKGSLWAIFGIHMARVLIGTALVAITWHFGLPNVGLGTWLLLSAARQLVSRLPLVPNKDLLFANFAIIVIGQDTALAGLIAVTAALTLLAHMIFILIFGVEALVKRFK
jgi:hypothetical protein